MKIQIETDKGHLLKEYHFDLNELMTRAQAETGVDPVHTSASVISEKIELDGIVLDKHSLIHLEKKLGDLAYSGDEAKAVKLRIKNQPKREGKALSAGGNLMHESELFEKIIIYPNDLYKEVYDSLIGLNEIKDRLIKEAIFMVSPEIVREWSKKKHKGKRILALKAVEQRSSFLIFGGDVGTGKTALAESFGHAVADSIGTQVKLLEFSILTRGGGIVGDMTRLITTAFKSVETEADIFKGPLILLLDEADTLAQSREAIQMHHEDKAGVNALVQGIDRLRFSKKHILVVFCTNRLSAIDPAIRRRAVDIFEFSRPNKEQREQIFNIYGKDINLTKKEITKLIDLTGPVKGREYGFTYSDLLNRVIPNAVFASFPDNPLSFKAFEKSVSVTIPTRPFEELTKSAK